MTCLHELGWAWGLLTVAEWLGYGYVGDFKEKGRSTTQRELQPVNNCQNREDTGREMLVMWVSIVLSLPNVKVSTATILICKMK